MAKKIAVITYNLGGPDSLDAVEPFLFNLFNDKHIITLPQPFRYFLAKTISFFRSSKSKGIYEKMGGRSTILPETQEQAKELSNYLNVNCSMERQIQYDVIPLMRYWHPMTEQVVREVRKGEYDNIVLIPMYPHFSTTTTLSSLREWFKKANDMPPTTMVCCYYKTPGFIDAYVDLISQTISKIVTSKTIRILFSAHSIPQHISDMGDPYKMQIEESVREIAEKLHLERMDNIKHTICYQSKVGRMKWLEPDIQSELLAAGKRDEVVVVVPISFTSEHSETLVELDIDYADLARDNNIDFYRVSTLRTHHLFIKTLAALVVKSLEKFYDGIVQESNLKPYEDIKIQAGCDAAMCCQRVNLSAD
jgi:ferrochelatase